MRFAGLKQVAARRAFVFCICVLPVLTGCHKAFVLRGSCCFNWIHGCENCDSCRAKIFPKHMTTSDCPTCGERGCRRKSCRAAKVGCYACGGHFPRLSRAFGLGCFDPRVPHGKHHGKHAGAPYQPVDPLSDWSDVGPGSFHPVPTRPVYGPSPTPVDATPDEDPSDPGMESIPLRDLPRNLDTPSDPRNLIPAPEELESTPEDFPPDASSSVRKKYPVEQTGWRARK
jgi:hypothetical protein